MLSCFFVFCSRAYLSSGAILTMVGVHGVHLCPNQRHSARTTIVEVILAVALAAEKCRTKFNTLRVQDFVTTTIRRSKLQTLCVQRSAIRRLRTPTCPGHTVHPPYPGVSRMPSVTIGRSLLLSLSVSVNFSATCKPP